MPVVTRSATKRALAREDAARNSDVVETDSSQPNSNHLPKTPFPRYDLRPRTSRKGTASSSSTISSGSSIFSGHSSTPGDSGLVETPSTDITSSGRSRPPSPEEKQSEAAYFNPILSRTPASDDVKYLPSTPEASDEDSTYHYSDSDSNAHSTSGNGTAADGSPSKRPMLRRQEQQRNMDVRSRGVNPRPADIIQHNDRVSSDESNEQLAEMPSLPDDIDERKRVAAVSALRPTRQRKKKSTKRLTVLSPRYQSENTQIRSQSLKGRPLPPVILGSSSNMEAGMNPEQNGPTSRLRAKDDLSLLSSSAITMRRETPLSDQADDQSESSSAARAAESHVLQASNPPSTPNEQEVEDPTVDIDHLSNPSISGENTSLAARNKSELVLLTPKEIKDNILQIMRKQKFKRVKDNPREIEEGLIYVFVSDNYEGCVKIGMTSRTAEVRRKELGIKCKITVSRIDSAQNMRFMHYQVVEKLVHAELNNKRYVVHCKHCGSEHCGKKYRSKLRTEMGVDHGEWFKIEQSEALQVVEKWRKWVVNHKPYHKPLRWNPITTEGQKDDKKEKKKRENDALKLREFWEVTRLSTESNSKIDLVVWDEMKWAWLLHYSWHALHEDIPITHPIVDTAGIASWKVNPKYWYPIIVCYLMLRFGVISGSVLFVLGAVCFVMFRYHSY